MLLFFIFVEQPDDKEIACIREKSIEKRKTIFQHTEQEVSRRWSFEEGVGFYDSVDFCHTMLTAMHVCYTDPEAIFSCEAT